MSVGERRRTQAMALNRKERRNQLKQRLAEDLFLTDAQLAEESEVSGHHPVGPHGLEHP